LGRCRSPAADNQGNGKEELEEFNGLGPLCGEFKLGDGENFDIDDGRPVGKALACHHAQISNEPSKKQTNHLMKTSLIAAVTFLSVQFVAQAADKAVLPDFAKAYPEEKIAHKMNLPGMENYTYLTNVTFDEWKQKMIIFLAEGWQESKVAGAELEMIAEPLKAQGMELSGVAKFSNEEFPGVMVIVMHMSMQAAPEGKKFSATVTVTGKKKE